LGSAGPLSIAREVMTVVSEGPDVADLTTTATPDPQVVCTELRNGESVLLHLGTQSYFTLNKTGTVIWRLMAQGMDLGGVARELSATYQVSRLQAGQNVLDLADQLAAEQLISLDNRPTRRSGTDARSGTSGG